MSEGRPFLTPEVARNQVAADLEVIDAALGRVRTRSTDLVGNASRVAMAERLERQHRVVRGLTYRVFSEIMDPPDGLHDAGPRGGAGPRRAVAPVADHGHGRDPACEAVRADPGATDVDGETVAPELPALADAVAAGDLGEDHIREVCTALDRLPHAAAGEKDRAERTLVRHARQQDAPFVAEVGRKIADTLNPDGFFDDRPGEPARVGVGQAGGRWDESAFRSGDSGGAGLS